MDHVNRRKSLFKLADNDVQAIAYDTKTTAIKPKQAAWRRRHNRLSWNYVEFFTRDFSFSIRRRAGNDLPIFTWTDRAYRPLTNRFFFLLPHRKSLSSYFVSKLTFCLASISSSIASIAARISAVSQPSYFAVYRWTFHNMFA